jgi:hypothetical protein
LFWHRRWVDDAISSSVVGEASGVGIEIADGDAVGYESLPE